MKYLSFAIYGLLLSFSTVGEVKADEKQDVITALAGTEWYMSWREGGQKGERVIRFTAEGTMRYQSKTRRWDDDNFVEEKTYEVMGPRRIQFGVDKYSVEFDEEFKRFSGTSTMHPDRSVRGSHRGEWNE